MHARLLLAGIGTRSQPLCSTASRRLALYCRLRAAVRSSIADGFQVFCKGQRGLLGVARGLALLLVVERGDDLGARADEVHALLGPRRRDDHVSGIAALEGGVVPDDAVLLAPEPEAARGRLALADGGEEALRLVDRGLLLGLAVLLEDLLLVVRLVDKAPASLALHRRSGVERAVRHLRERTGVAVALGEQPLLDGRVPASLLLLSH
mmetsp:Transcript_96715/g.301694  ORF Transcript_96715/g.301694 Transcript_96715/m.301694 type:complete len:208 (+) Transcript_96715:127-750(+)